MFKQIITVDGVRTRVTHAVTVEKARRWLDNVEGMWRAKSATVIRESLDRLVIVTADAQTIVIENKSFAPLKLVEVSHGA